MHQKNFKIVSLFLGLTFLFTLFFFLPISQVFAESNTSSITTTRTLKLAIPMIKGDDVKELQTFLNNKGYDVGIADGYFGPKTQSAVKLFQTANNLTPDGLVGPMTREIMNFSSIALATGCTSTTGFSTTTGQLCATTPVADTTGCTSDALFSTITGQSCANTLIVSTLGCTPGALFNTTTGASCGTLSALPAGCTSTSLFSTTSGVSCSTGLPAYTAPRIIMSGSSGPSLHTIRTSTIAGITVPANDGTPTTTITATEEYTATIVWTGTPTVFTGNTAYTATITLTPKSDYTQRGITANYFTVSGANATNLEDSGIITAIFPATPQKQLTISPSSLTTSKVYNNNTTAAVTIGTLSGKVGTDVVTVTGVATYDNMNIGTGKTITTVYTLGGANASKYIKPIDETVSTGIITPIQLTISSLTITTSKQYDRNTTAEVTANALIGVVPTEDVSIATVVATYNDATVATGKTITVIYTITGASAANYIKPVDFTTSSGIITPKQLYIADPVALTLSKSYDNSNSVATCTARALSGVLSPDTVGATCVATYNDATVAINKTITIVYTLTGADAGNYTKPVDGTNATGVITQKALTVTAVTDSKTYDGTITSSGIPTVGTLVTGDVVNIAPTQTYDNSNVGITHTMTASGLTIKDGASADMTANYNISYITNETGIINPVLTYTARANGSIDGTSSQAIDYNTSGTLVTATPSANYHFVEWSDNHSTLAARTDTNVINNITATASFAIDTYALTIPTATGTGTGSYGGTSSDSVDYNTDVSITATPDVSSNFTSWTATGAASTCDGTTSSPCAFSMTGVASVTAVYTLKTFTLTYSAGAGTLTGSSPQTVNYGASGSEVTANPPANYHFTTWSDTLATAARTDTNVTSNISVTASFAIDTYTLTYTAGDNGSIVGTTPQTINHGSNGSEVTATPSANYHFVKWSDDVMTASRTDTNITTNKSVTATFAIDTYTVTFDWNGGDGGATAPQSLPYNTPTTLTTNGFTRTSYTFASWNTQADGLGTSYVNGANYIIGATNVTIYAQWNIVLTIGMAYQGGKVFYILQPSDTGYNANIQHGLISATADPNAGAMIRWYNGTNLVTGATGTAIGTGLANTDAIITNQSAIATSYAAGIARAYNGGGYTDWYLPSKNELNQLYTQKNVVGEFFPYYYWSSSEVSSTDAWFQVFDNGTQYSYTKSYEAYVPAVRAF